MNILPVLFFLYILLKTHSVGDIFVEFDTLNGQPTAWENCFSENLLKKQLVSCAHADNKPKKTKNRFFATL